MPPKAVVSVDLLVLKHLWRYVPALAQLPGGVWLREAGYTITRMIRMMYASIGALAVELRERFAICGAMMGRMKVL